MQQFSLFFGVGTNHLFQQLAARDQAEVGAARFGEQCLKGKACDVFFAQLRQDVGNVTSKQIIRRDDDDVVSIQLLGDTFVKEEGNTVQSNRSFAAASNTLNKYQLI